MAVKKTGLNIAFPIYNADGTSFHNLVIRKASYESVVMSLGDKITGDVYYKDNTLVVTMQEYIVYEGVHYQLVSPPTIVREGMVSDNGDLKGMTKYSFVFHHPMYILSNLPFSDIAVNNSEEKYLSQSKTFSWIGRLQDFIAKINANLEGTQWHAMYKPSSATSKASELSEVLSFDKNTIADALKNAYDTWEVPFIIINYDGMLPMAYKRLEYVKIEEIRQLVSGEESPLFLFLNNLPSVIADDNRIYYSKIYNGDELVLHLIPCMNSTNDVGLYDAVSGNAFWSNTDVTFSAGNVIGYGKNYEIIFGLPSNEIYGENGEVFVFKFGKGVGLKNNSRTPRNNKIVTRIVGAGAERNVPYGYPQILWTGNQAWNYTIDNDSTNPNSYPIYNGIVGGVKVRLIKHPFTRSRLMPSVYVDTVNKKVNPRATGYNPQIEIIDYYDAPQSYPNPFNALTPSVEIHEFDDIYPELGEAMIVDAVPWDEPKNASGESYGQYISWNDFVNVMLGYMDNNRTQREYDALNNMLANMTLGDASGQDAFNGGSYTYQWYFSSDADFFYAKYISDNVNFEYAILKDEHVMPTPTWNDDMDENGNYIQNYFKMTLPVLSFDLYASASITEKMDIYMRGGACMGCTFPIEVDWEDYKANFYDSDGNFDPVIGQGHPRDEEKYPDTSQQSVTFIVKKEIDTFGTLMPNIYQQPHAGDEFVILGISLPTTYISDAESRLDDAMMEYMLENNVHYYDYPLKFDEHFLATHTDILEQIHNNTIVRFKYANTNMTLYVKQISIKYGEQPLPKYDITLTDDVEIVLNQIGQVTDDVSRIRVQMSELQKYYGENVVEEINSKLSRISDDVAQGRITFQQGLNAIGNVILNDEIKSDVYDTGLYTGRGWRIDHLGNAEMESLKVRSYLEVVELLVNRMRAQEGDTMFTDNDQIDKVEPFYEHVLMHQGDNPKLNNWYERSLVDGDYVYTLTDDTTIEVGKEYFYISSYILSLKEKYDGYVTPQQFGNILKGTINTLAAKQAGISNVTGGDGTDAGGNKYFTSWMRVVDTHTTSPSSLAVNQIKVVLYGDNDVPADTNFVPCELMTIARWGCALDPSEEGISNAEKESRRSRQNSFYISTSEGRIVKLVGVNKPILENWNYGTTLGLLPDFVKNYGNVRERIIEGRDYLYAQGVVVGDFIKVNVQGQPISTIVDCGDWVNGSTAQNPTVGNGIYLCNEYNENTLQYETHRVRHNNAIWQCLQHQPVSNGGVSTYYEPKSGSPYWQLVDGVVRYSLLPSVSGVVYNPNNQTYSPTTVYCSYSKFVGEEEIVSQDDAKIYYTKDNDTQEFEYTSSGVSAGSDGFTTKVTFLLKVGNSILDKKSVSVVRDGTNGGSGDNSTWYEIRTSVETIKITKPQTSVTTSVVATFFCHDGRNAPQTVEKYYGVYKRKGNVYVQLSHNIDDGVNQQATFSVVDYDALVFVIADSTFAPYGSEIPSTYLAKKEVPVVADGEDGDGAHSIRRWLQVTPESINVLANGKTEESMRLRIEAWEQVDDNTPTRKSESDYSDLHVYYTGVIKNANGGDVISAPKAYGAYKIDADQGDNEFVWYNWGWQANETGGIVAANANIIETLEVTWYVDSSLTAYYDKKEIVVNRKGDMGRNYYYAGEYDQNEDYLLTDYEAPFVSYDINNITRYYVRVGASGTISTIDPWNDNDGVYWELMTSDFKYVIAEAVFSNFAKLGSSIFNKDYMFSQYCYAKGLGGIKMDIPSLSYSSITYYNKIDPNDVFGEGDMYMPTSVFNIYDIQTAIGSRTENYEVDNDNWDASKCSVATNPEINAGEYYTLQINASVVDGTLDFSVAKEISGSALSDSIYDGSIQATAQASFFSFYYIFRASSSGVFSVYFRRQNSTSISQIKDIYLRPCKYVPQMAMNLLTGKAAFNDIDAHGTLHADSLSYDNVLSNNNNDTLRVDGESIVTLGSAAVGTRIILPTPATCKGRKIEIYSIIPTSSQWYVTWDGANSSAQFYSMPTTSGYNGYVESHRVVDGFGGTSYLLVYSDGDKWIILKQETVFSSDGKRWILNALFP